MEYEWIGLDADDTLWHNEREYRRGRDLFLEMMADYGIDEGDISLLDHIEVKNLQHFGYGAVGFAISLVEAGIELTGGEISSREIKRLLDVSKDILNAEVEVFPEVEDTLETLSDSFRLIMITKGDLLHQRKKIQASGLSHYFLNIEIVHEKNPDTYREILQRHQVLPSKFLMVGNAMRSDILPVLSIGGSAVYLHNELTWEFEEAERIHLPPDRYFEIHALGDLPGMLRVDKSGTSPGT